MGRNAGSRRAACDHRVQCSIRFVFGDVCGAVASTHAVKGDRDREVNGKEERIDFLEREREKRLNLRGEV